MTEIQFKRLINAIEGVMDKYDKEETLDAFYKRLKISTIKELIESASTPEKVTFEELKDLIEAII